MKSHLALRLLVLVGFGVVWGHASVTNALTAIESPWSAPTNGWSLKLAVGSSEVAVGKPMSVQVYLKNTTDKERVVRMQNTMFTFKFTNTNGVQAITPNIKDPPPEDGDIRGRHITRVGPDKALQVSTPIDWRDIPQEPGTYHLSFAYEYVTEKPVTITPSAPLVIKVVK